MSNKPKSLGVNAALNALRSGLSIIFPLITYPYALRVLHAEGIGRVNYASSIVSYFTMLASLGFANYATREGAKIRNDQERFNSFACEIFTLNLCSTALSVSLLIISLILVNGFHDYSGLILLLGSTIIFNTISLEWVNAVYEDFLFITVRTIATQLVSMSLLFLIVRSADDVYPYAMLTVITQIIVCVANYWYCRKYIHVRPVWGFDFARHLKPVLIFFANSIATTLYVNSDTTMLGWMEGDYYVGIYAASVKVYTVVKTMLSALYGVVVPRISFHIGQGDDSGVKDTYTKVFCNVLIVLLPSGAGLACIANEIMTFMGGEEYLAGTLTLQILSISLIGAILNGLVTYCLNIPTGRERMNAKATIYSACINIGLNLILIPLWKQNGAAVTTAISELFVFVYCFLHDRDVLDKYLDRHKTLHHLALAILGMVTIALIGILIRFLPLHYLIRMMLIIILSVLAYGIELLIAGNELARDILNKVTSKIGIR